MKRAWTWVWVLLALLIAAGALSFLWWWQNNRQVGNGNCTSQDLTPSIGQTNGTAGTQYIHVVVTNSGKRTCVLNGYPATSLLDANGNRLLSDAQQNNSLPATAIVLSPHTQAYVVLGIPDANNFDSGACSDTSHTLRLYLPGNIVGMQPLSIDMAQKVCPGFSVTAFQPGA